MGTIATSRDGTYGWPRRLERFWLKSWPLFVAANLVAAFTLSFRATDLNTIRAWGHALLADGANLYTRVYWCDYPPNAMVALAPLAWLPEAHAPWIWALVNIELALVAPLLVAQALQRPRRRRELVVVASTFWCWTATHTLLQFTLLAMVCGIASWMTARRRPVISGLCLGLALIKPQIAAPFVLWCVFTRRWRVLAIASATVTGMTLMYCAASQSGPVLVVVGYLDVLRGIYTGSTTLPGASDLRPLVVELAPGEWVDAIANGLVVVLLAALGVVGVRMRRRGDVEMPGFVGLACAWALLSFRQLSYGLVLLLPLSAWLMLSAEGHLTRRQRAWMFWVLQLLLIADVPTYFRRIEPLAPGLVSIGRVLAHFDRVSLLALFVVLLSAIDASARPQERTSPPTMAT